MMCVKSLVLMMFISTLFAASKYAMRDDVSDVSGDEEEVVRIIHGAPVVTRRKTLTNSGSTFASSYTNLTTEVLKEVAIQTAKNKLLKIKSELDLTVWKSVEEVFLTNDPKSIIRLLDEVSAKRVAGPDIGPQRNGSLQQGISSIARNLSKATLSPLKKTDSMDNLSFYDGHASDSPDGYSNEY